MDPLKPKMISVDGRSYRSFESSISSNSADAAYTEDNYEPLYDDEEFSDPNIEIVPFGSMRFKHSFHVPMVFFSRIIGVKHATRKRLESETKTKIQIPTAGQDGEIVIIGFDERSIITARRRIDLLIEAARKTIRPTHFLSIPLNDDNIISKFIEFKNDILLNYGTSRGIEEILFQEPRKLHLTLGVLVLLDDADRKQAIEALDYCKENVVKDVMQKYGSISIRLKGIDIMNDDPAEASVLYAEVENRDEGLQELSDKVAEHFLSVGLFKPDRGKTNVKLHLTLMNSKFRNKDEDRKSNTIHRFDVTSILQAHKDIYFGEVTLKQILLSQRHTTDNNGYYITTSEISVTGD